MFSKTNFHYNSIPNTKESYIHSKIARTELSPFLPGTIKSLKKLQLQSSYFSVQRWFRILNCATIVPLIVEIIESKERKKMILSFD